MINNVARVTWYNSHVTTYSILKLILHCCFSISFVYYLMVSDSKALRNWDYLAPSVLDFFYVLWYITLLMLKYFLHKMNFQRSSLLLWNSKVYCSLFGYFLIDGPFKFPHNYISTKEQHTQSIEPKITERKTNFLFPSKY